MYIGVLSVIFGWSLLFQSLSLAICGFAVAACFHLFVVLDARSVIVTRSTTQEFTSSQLDADFSAVRSATRCKRDSGATLNFPSSRAEALAPIRRRR